MTPAPTHPMPNLRLLAITSAMATILHAQGDAPAPRDTSRYTTVGAVAGYTDFRGDIAPWRDLSISIARHAPGGSLIARINVGSHFGETGTQLEVDAYPHLGPGRYLYVNAGYSGSSIFPTERVGAEIYTNLPHAWEASVGLRTLWFGGSPVALFTGTVGKYAGNYWISVRPYVHQSATGTSASAGLTVRRYTADADNYLGGSVSAGSSPTDRITPDLVGRTSSTSIGLQGSATVGRTLIVRWTAGYDSEGIAPGNTRRDLSVSVGTTLKY